MPHRRRPTRKPSQSLSVRHAQRFDGQSYRLRCVRLAFQTATGACASLVQHVSAGLAWRQAFSSTIRDLEAKQRRELQFLKQGATKLTEQAAAELRRVRGMQEKALQRAVREADERGAEALSRQRAGFEAQLSALRYEYEIEISEYRSQIAVLRSNAAAASIADSPDAEPSLPSSVMGASTLHAR